MSLADEVEGGILRSAYGRFERLSKELIGPAERLESLGVRHTVTFFGSSRLGVNFSKECRRVAPVGEKSCDVFAFFKGASQAHDPERLEGLLNKEQAGRKFYLQVYRLAYELALWSEGLGGKWCFTVATGGGPGLMNAANHGAWDAGADSLGMNITLPFEQYPNDFTPEDSRLHFDYFISRKFWLSYLARALVVAPGGFGTLDELFEVLTLLQTGKITRSLPIVLLGGAFWERLVDFGYLVESGVIAKEDLKLFRIFDDVFKARDYLIERLTSLYLT